MSYFDDASLVMIPSGYKNQKVYSVKPLDGSGDLTFSRASSATRVASNGLIEKVRTNLVLQSQAFNTTANWPTNASPTITANTTVAPDGTTTADTIAATGSFSGVYQSPVNVSNGVEHSWSVYIKNISSASNIFLGIASNPSNASLNYNATSGTITSSGAGLVASSATNVGNGWYRLSGTYVTTGTTNDFVIYGMGTMSFAVWGAQLETGVTTDYIATTSAAVSVGPVSGVPRLDYTNSSCPKILLEPQRSNSVTRSEAFDDAAWQKTAAGTGVAPAITANYATSPSGYQDADLVVFNRGAGNTSSDFSWIYQNFVTSAATYTISCYVKAATSADIGKNLSWRNFGGGDAWDVTLTNEWQRISVQATGSGSTQEVGFYNRGTYTAANSVSVLMWGFQAEVGAYATSYIPTLGTSVTRVADAASKTGISSLIGQTEGTLFVEFNAQDSTGAGQAIATIYQNSSNVIILYKQNDNILKCFVVTAGTLVADLGSVTVSGNVKMAIAYKSNDFALYINGTQRGVDTAGAVPACSNLYLGADDGGAQKMTGKVSQALLFKTRLTNSQLAELTSL